MTKRKLNEDYVPATTEEKESATDKEVSRFEALNLDTRILQAAIAENFTRPTAVQAQAIPLILEGKDIVVRAKTGSGKTLAYVLPLLENVLRSKLSDESTGSFRLVLVPTKELGEQVLTVLSTFSAYCAKALRILNLTQKNSEAVQRSQLAEKPDIIIGTPAGVRNHLEGLALDPSALRSLVIDEADLVLSYDYEEDIRAIATLFPQHVQSILVSATISSEVNALRELFCREPIVLELDQQGEKSNAISQFVVKCAEEDKFLLLYVILKLKLIKDKCIIFVNDLDRCYRLKLFLEQFGVKSCVLNSELAVNSRLHVVEAYNKNVYDIIIAADENEVIGSEYGRKKRRNGQDKEFGVSRGIDFKNVACVLNFDLPTTSRSYTHRIGRTGRSGKTGMAFSFAVPRALHGKHKPTSIKSTENDEEILAEIAKHQQSKGQVITDYQFDMAQVDSFRYRMNDALRAVTANAVREARTRELRQELINSDKLKRHFEENPQDLLHLRHDGELKSARVQSHLKHVPDYLMPVGGKAAISQGDIGFVGFKKAQTNRSKKVQKRMHAKGKQSTSRKANPLKTFGASRKRK